MAYALGSVKPQARALAEYFGPKHGFTTVYGWRAVGSVPGSDHPKGLAIDFMTSDKAKGDRLVADLIGNASSWGITYIIWYRRIWQNGEWDSYKGPSPHTNHVHVSVSESGTVPVSNQTVGLSDAADAIKYLANISTWLTDPNNWRRIIYMIAGAMLIAIAIGSLASQSTAASNLIKVIKDAKG